MAKIQKITVVGVKASSIAMFEGTLSGIIGLGVAIVYSLGKTFELAASTNSVLAGMAFGLALVSLAFWCYPLVYSGIGWVLGYLRLVLTRLSLRLPVSNPYGRIIKNLSQLKMTAHNGLVI